MLESGPNRKAETGGDLVAGINLEGTFLQDPTFAGAQNPDYFYPLEKSILQSLRDTPDAGEQRFEQAIVTAVCVTPPSQQVDL